MPVTRQAQQVVPMATRIPIPWWTLTVAPEFALSVVVALRSHCVLEQSEFPPPPAGEIPVFCAAPLAKHATSPGLLIFSWTVLSGTELRQTGLATATP